MSMRVVCLGVLLVTALVLPSSEVSAQSLKDRLKKAAEKVEKGAEKIEKSAEKTAAKGEQFAASAGTLLPIGPEKETEIGRSIAATVAGRYRMSNDSVLTAYVSLVGLVVAGEFPRNDIAYRFAVLETPDVNAFAAPGGYIFVTRGALDIIESEAELAGVLAHEIGHVNKKHVIEQIRKADVMREVKDQTGLSGETLDKIVGHGSNLLFTGLSRDDEMEADSLAVEYAASAGYDAAGLHAFVTKLAAKSSEGRLSELMSTHPRPADRVAQLERIAAQKGTGGATLADRYAAFARRR